MRRPRSRRGVRCGRWRPRTAPEPAHGRRPQGADADHQGTGFQAPTAAALQPDRLAERDRGHGEHRGLHLRHPALGECGRDRQGPGGLAADGDRDQPRPRHGATSGSCPVHRSGGPRGRARGPESHLDDAGTATLPPTPQVTKITPLSAPAGFAPVTITGKNFSATAANNLVTFTTANNLRVVATITSATSSDPEGGGARDGGGRPGDSWR